MRNVNAATRFFISLASWNLILRLYKFDPYEFWLYRVYSKEIYGKEYFLHKESLKIALRFLWRKSWQAINEILNNEMRLFCRQVDIIEKNLGNCLLQKF